MFSAPQRHLPYPLDRASNLECIVPDGLEVCGLPEFPEDSDEQITVLFRLSLNQFVALATAIDVGSDIAYGDDGIPVWFLWAASVMCAQFCEEMAECLENEDDAVVGALANLLANNPIMQRAIAAAAASQGAPVPGQELPDETTHRDSLPENVRDEFGECNLDALWGACLGLVQFGNRAIVDFFEILEVGTNALERGAIATGAIPAAGNSISAAIEFADQILEEVAEGYNAVYTETYEQQLACALFCAARVDCELNIDEMIQILVDRLSLDSVEDFYAVMQWVITGTYTGAQLADTAFLMFFTAIKFGTEFAGVVGVRALTVYMGLSADVLASDNWEALCDCPETWEQVLDFTVDDWGFTAPYGTYEEGIGFVSGEIEATLFYTAISASREIVADITYLEAIYDTSGVAGDPQTDRIWVDSDTGGNWLATATNEDGIDRELSWSDTPRAVTAIGFTAAASACEGDYCGGEVILKSMTVRGNGTNPFL